MRGKVAFNNGSGTFSGITPAYAGKSADSHSAVMSARDHPCVCGEKSRSAGSTAKQRGSPLRMRGKEGDAIVYETVLRITPAYAGKSKLTKGS